MLERLQKRGYVRYENLPLKPAMSASLVEFVSNVYEVGGPYGAGGEGEVPHGVPRHTYRISAWLFFGALKIPQMKSVTSANE